jgi:hypothetical protein
MVATFYMSWLQLCGGGCLSPGSPLQLHLRSLFCVGHFRVKPT